MTCQRDGGERGDLTAFLAAQREAVLAIVPAWARADLASTDPGGTDPNGTGRTGPHLR